MPRHLTTNDSSMFVPATEVGVANGVAGLDGNGHVPQSQLPASVTTGVSMINGLTGNVTLGAANLGAVPTSEVGQPNGVASLDVNGKLPLGNLPASVVTSVNTHAGPNITLSAADVGALTQAAADGRYLPLTGRGAASGVASLDSSALVPVAQVPPLPASQITSGVLGTAQIPDLSATYVANAKIGAASGVASLDSTSHLTASQLPTSVVTQSSGDTRYQQLTYAPRNDLGVYVPPGWGQFWKPKRNASGTGLATVACVGSSSTQGLYSSNLISTSWVGRLITGLQGSYGDGGSGYFGTGRSAAFLGASAATTAWQAVAGNLVTQSGTWQAGNHYGPGANYIYSSNNGDNLTFTIRGTSARIYTSSGGGNHVNYTYSVDGATAVSVTDSGSGSASVQVTSITGLTAGTHTIKITHNGTTGNFLSIYGVTGENTAGVVVNNYGLSGAISSNFAYNVPGTAVANWSGGPDYKADLVIYMLGANDVLSGLSADSWSSNLRQYLSAVKDGTSVGGTAAQGATDVLIAMQHIGNYDSTNFRYHDYIARGRTVAEAFGAAFVALWPLGRNSWNYWNSLGYWGNSGTVGVAGTDAIHMSDAGHQYTANTILPILTAA